MIRCRTLAFWLPLSLIMTVALAACGGNGPEGAAPGGSGSNAGGLAGVSLEVGQLVPDFTVSTGGGSSFSLSGHRGEIILLYFSFPG